MAIRGFANKAPVTSAHYFKDSQSLVGGAAAGVLRSQVGVILPDRQTNNSIQRDVVAGIATLLFDSVRKTAVGCCATVRCSPLMRYAAEALRAHKRAA